MMDQSMLQFVCEADLQITERVSFGVSLQAVRERKAPMPPDGVRENLAIDGRISGSFQGDMHSIDYYRMAADGIGHSNAYGVLTTEDGATILSHVEGVTHAASESQLTIRQTWTLYSAHKQYQWVNHTPMYAVGQIDLNTGKMNLKAYAALQEMTTNG